MKEILSDEDIHHPLNEEILEEATRVKKEKILLQQRIEKLDECKSGVSQTVYERVHSDYKTQVNKALEKLMSLKKGLEEQEKILVDKKTLVEVNTKQHNEMIEESQLRHSLGEYSAEKHQGIIEKETKELQRLAQALKLLNDGLDRHRVIFDAEAVREVSAPLAAAPAPKTPPREPAAPKTPPPPVAEMKPESKETKETKAPEPKASEVKAPPKVTPIKPAPASAPASDVTSFIDAAADDRTDRFMPPSSNGHPAKVANGTQMGAELLVMDNGKVTKMVPLGRNIVIGRSPASDVVLKEPKVSRKHAEIQFAGGKYIILDLESSNGTYVGGKKITEQVLQAGDEIMIGNTKMVFKN